jgi:hypothetical protein
MPTIIVIIENMAARLTYKRHTCNKCARPSRLDDKEKARQLAKATQLFKKTVRQSVALVIDREKSAHFKA